MITHLKPVVRLIQRSGFQLNNNNVCFIKSNIDNLNYTTTGPVVSNTHTHV